MIREGFMEQMLQDFMWDFFSSVGIPAHSYCLSDQHCTRLDQGLRQDILGMTNHSEIVNRRLAAYEENTVYYEADIFQCNYAGMKLPCGDFLIVGPVLFERMTPPRFEELFQSLKLPEKLRLPLQNYYKNLKYSPLQGPFEKIINLWADYIYGKNGYRIIRNDAYSLKELGQFYCDCSRVPDGFCLDIQIVEELCALENTLSRAVMAGNEALALECVDGLQEKILPLYLPNEPRDVKDYIISMNMLLKKSAEQAGVHPIHLESFYNRNIQYVEQLVSDNQCRNFARKVAQGYCKIVQNYNVTEYALPIQKVIIYVNANLTADLSLKVLAEQINVNASYLSYLFKKEVGIPLTEYVNRCRITHAKLLLLSTAMPTKSIGLQCGISDTYYFSRLFKRYAGMTPRAYREYSIKKFFPELAKLDRQAASPPMPQEKP